VIESIARVDIDERPEGTVIAIRPALKPWQRVALYTWLVLWVLSGTLAFAGMTGMQNDAQRVYAIVFLAFWAYFLFLVGRTAWWYQRGTEYLRITSDAFDYKRSWAGYGRAQHFDLGTMREVGLINHDSNLFAKTYAQAFWSIGSERIGFEYIGRKVVFGLRLSDKQSSDILRSLTKAQNRAEKK
jgi:hypothetical protein